MINFQPIFFGALANQEFELLQKQGQEVVHKNVR